MREVLIFMGRWLGADRDKAGVEERLEARSRVPDLGFGAWGSGCRIYKV